MGIRQGETVRKDETPPARSVKFDEGLTDRGQGRESQAFLIAECQFSDMDGRIKVRKKVRNERRILRLKGNRKVKSERRG